MTEKELRKLKRGDFLQLLLAQGKDLSAAQAELDAATEELKQLRAANERLKARLDEKEAQAEELKGRLDDRDAAVNALRQEIENLKTSRRIALETADSAAAAPLSLDGIFEVAREAVEQYLRNLHLLNDEPETKD